MTWLHKSCWCDNDQTTGGHQHEAPPVDGPAVERQMTAIMFKDALIATLTTEVEKLSKRISELEGANK